MTTETMQPKPPGSTWTDDQWQAIAVRGQNTLVAAAAGSGKTAVLVERIIRRISDETDPLDVDRILVATFTKAAASEMRERIRIALEKALLDSGGSDHLRRQLALIGRASIMTLHSFCLELVKRNVHALPIEPGFRIANEIEAQLLQQEALENVLEQYYSNSADDSPFWTLVEWFNGGRADDKKFMDHVLNIYEASRSQPEPNVWLEQMVVAFENRDPNAQSSLFKCLLPDIQIELEAVQAMLQQALTLCGHPEAPSSYAKTLQPNVELAASLLQAADAGWGQLYHACQLIDFGRLTTPKKEEFDPQLQKKIKYLRDSAKALLKKNQDLFFSRHPDDFIKELLQMAPLMHTLIEVVNRFGERFLTAKREKGLVDFSDLEHDTLAILRDPTCVPGEWRPSAIALQYREQFLEILLDEYQDTNHVQEMILSLLSRDGAGNRFMVGDVKQSIYRFRLAEPGLFLQKFKSYAKVGGTTGIRIDLARNFRSRREVVDGANFLFRQLMNETVGEVDYDDDAALVYGAGYPEQSSETEPNPFVTEVVLINRLSTGEVPYEEPIDDEEDQEDGPKSEQEDEETFTQAAQLEARQIGATIKKMMGMQSSSPFPVFDKKAGGFRAAQYRDFVILVRASKASAPVMIEELKLLGIPAYAELSTGYFEATEVETMISLLQVIDNPLQDIPLAAVLRSPIVGLSAEQLASLRLTRREGSFADAIMAIGMIGNPNAASLSESNFALDDAEDNGTDNVPNTEVIRRTREFLSKLEGWRSEARQGALSALIWQLYRETGYYDFAGGMPGGLQRQANLRALYDRAKQYEATSLRGLFRFLRFVERMKDTNKDLGTARALGEQEDVVRIMTIHSSKGLEFPVVFVAGLGKQFNNRDLNESFLLHKELGFGPKFVDTTLRISYPTLPYMAIQHRMHKEMLAEELRILYVALTRAREKLILIGTVKELDKQVAKWAAALECETVMLPDFDRLQARRYIDWIGPALIRHPDASSLCQFANIEHRSSAIRSDEQSRFSMSIVHENDLILATDGPIRDKRRRDWLGALLLLEPVTLPSNDASFEVDRRLSWHYPNPDGARLFSKTSVTELKRRSAIGSDELPSRVMMPSTSHSKQFESAPAFRRPSFMGMHKLSATERGTAYHAVMQYLPLHPGLTLQHVKVAITQMLDRKLLTIEQAHVLDPSFIYAFFETKMGQKLLHSTRVLRELPFSYGIRAGELEPLTDPVVANEMVLIQGVIDCLFESEEGLVLLDFKTDKTSDYSDDDLRERYRLQLTLYAKAIEEIWKRPVVQRTLYFFDGCRTIPL